MCFAFGIYSGVCCAVDPGIEQLRSLKTSSERIQCKAGLTEVSLDPHNALVLLDEPKIDAFVRLGTVRAEGLSVSTGNVQLLSKLPALATLTLNDCEFGEPNTLQELQKYFEKQAGGADDVNGTWLRNEVRPEGHTPNRNYREEHNIEVLRGLPVRTEWNDYAAKIRAAFLDDSNGLVLLGGRPDEAARFTSLATLTLTDYQLHRSCVLTLSGFPVLETLVFEGCALAEPAALDDLRKNFIKDDESAEDLNGSWHRVR
jgi:hypothetical protein